VTSGGAPRGVARSWLAALRVHHWVKNLLVFVPAAAAKLLLDPLVLPQACTAFVAFCLVASGGYIVNDLVDLSSDRVHPIKRQRPFAKGELRVPHGVIGAAILTGAGLAIGYGWLGWQFVTIQAAYLAGSLWYSLDMKRRAVIDILFLAGLYTLRILAGGAATGIMPSFWLLAFSMFLFLSLAAAKRSAELAALQARSEQRAPGRGYSVDDLPLLLASGVAAAYSSVLVLALYVFLEASTLYSRPEVLWLLCPAVLFWVSRIWLKAQRRQLDEDPLVFAFTDVPSVAAGILCIVLVLLAA